VTTWCTLPSGGGSLHHNSSVSGCCQANHRAGHEERKEGGFGGDEARAVRVKELVGGRLPAIDGSVERHAVGFPHTRVRHTAVLGEAPPKPHC